ncbi:hypothetical protein H311_05250, partial [Anncaliia algerae PRA109]
KGYLNVKGVNQKFVFLCSNISEEEKKVESENINKILFGENERLENENIQNLPEEAKKFNSNFYSVEQGIRGVYERISETLFPNIFGHRSIKNAILLMFVGGVRKI